VRGGREKCRFNGTSTKKINNKNALKIELHVKLELSSDISLDDQHQKKRKEIEVKYKIYYVYGISMSDVWVLSGWKIYIFFLILDKKNVSC
jgi:hypothetical protein